MPAEVQQQAQGARDPEAALEVGGHAGVGSATRPHRSHDLPPLRDVGPGVVLPPVGAHFTIPCRTAGASAKPAADSEPARTRRTLVAWVCSLGCFPCCVATACRCAVSRLRVVVAGAAPYPLEKGASFVRRRARTAAVECRACGLVGPHGWVCSELRTSVGSRLVPAATDPMAVAGGRPWGGRPFVGR